MHYLISKALRYGPHVTKGSHSFTCHPHTNHTCLYTPTARHHRPLADTNLYCLVTEAHICEKHAQSFYAACPAETRTHGVTYNSTKAEVDTVGQVVCYYSCHINIKT